MSEVSTAQRAAKVLLVDDHPAIREALAIRISKIPDLELCGETEDMAEALRLILERKPDVAVVDISLKTGDGLDLIKRIRARQENVRILVWSMHSETVYAERALAAGAQGYITKEHATEQIVAAIRQVLAGKVYLNAAMTERLLRRAVGGPGEEKTILSPLDVITDRELQIFRMIGQGIKTPEIAERLHLSVKTVETHRDRIKKKLDLKDGAELVRRAILWVIEES